MSTVFKETADIETASDSYAERFSGAAGKYFLDVQTEITLQCLQEFPGASILDVGGGHAQLARPLINKGYRLTVTGSSDECRRRLDQEYVPGSFLYQTCDSLNLPYDDNQFDIVMSFRLLPHAEEWKSLLSEMCRVAHKTVIFDYPDRRSANILYDLLFGLKQSIEGNTRTYTLFTRGEIRRELKANCFGSTKFHPEFFIPMVVHRKLNSAGLSRSLELVARMCGLTSLFGSPIIVRSDRTAT